MKREKLIGCLLAVALLLGGCGSPGEQDAPQTSQVPGRMVTDIEIAVTPSDETMVRHYTDIEKMSSILRFLRDMDTDELPEEMPRLDDGQTYYTITATYANGTSRVYFLLSHQYLRVNQEQWHQISTEDATELIQYIRATPDTGTPETEPTPTQEKT